MKLTLQKLEGWGYRTVIIS